MQREKWTREARIALDGSGRHLAVRGHRGILTYGLRELRLRYRGFRQLGILGPGTFCYVLKPLAVGAVPAPVHHTVRRWQKGGLL